jgi:type II secretory pathway component GspD/PulD (secretin)
VTGSDRRRKALGRAAVVIAALAGTAAGQNQAGEAGSQTARDLPGGGQPAPGQQGGQAPPAQEGISVPEPDFEGTIKLPAFTEPVHVRTLIDYAIREIGVQVAVDTEFEGSIVLTQPIEVDKRDYLRLLNSFIEQHGFAMFETDIPHFYEVRRGGQPPVRMGGELASTIVIPTPNMRPSSLEAILAQQFGVEATPGSLRASFIDDLGVILATGSPRQLRSIRELVEGILAQGGVQRLIPFDLTYVTAPEARNQVLELVGLLQETGQPRQLPGRAEQQQQQPSAGSSGSLSNLQSKLIVARSGNTLMFKGTDEEAQQVADLLRLIDRPNNLEPKQYFTGTQTTAVAQFAETRGLGTVVRVSATDTTPQGQFARQQQQMQQQLQQQFGGLSGAAQSVGGSLLVADEARGQIVYYGTPEQHAELAALVEQIGAKEEQVVMRAYRLHWADAEAVTEIITGLIERRQPAVDSPLAAQGTGRQQQQQPLPQPGARPELPQSEQRDTVSDIGEESFIIADVGNNQVIVKARLAEQPQFARLISTIDRRRPQVYLETKIVAVTWTDDLRLAFESQVVSGQFGFRSDFGLTSAPEGGGFLDPVNVSTTLGGFTGALIKNKYVPIVVNALQREVNGRIVSAPQILVDDNEETEVASVEQQPFLTTTTGQTTDQTSFGGFEDAGTRLTVTPRISPGGFVTLDYDLELSNFVGSGSEGSPPPRQKRNVVGYVTIPSDATVIVGGIKVDDESDTIIKIPLLGDIPLLGYLFRDTRLRSAKTELLVFITPRILYEPTLSDYQLLTKGPQAEALLDPDIPPLETFMVHAAATRPRDSRQLEGAPPPPVEPPLPAGGE